jgi:hypothetical protein
MRAVLGGPVFGAGQAILDPLVVQPLSRSTSTAPLIGDPPFGFRQHMKPPSAHGSAEHRA